MFGRPCVDAIIDYTEGGGGLIEMHVASVCFRNSTDFANLLGGRFLGHYAYQEFTPNVPSLFSHPITAGLGTYTSSDAPYQIKNLSSDVTMLGTREPIGNEVGEKPYTWLKEVSWVDVNSPDEIILIARLQGTGVNYTNDLTLLRLDLGGEAEILLREGQSLAGGALAEGSENWEVCLGISRLVARVAIKVPGGEIKDAIYLLEGDQSHRLVGQGDIIDESGDPLTLSVFREGILSCAGAQLVIRAELRDPTDDVPTGDALLLLGLIHSRLLARTGWSLPDNGDPFLVDSLDYQGGGAGFSGLSSDAIVFAVGAPDGQSRIVKMDLTDSLDGDLYPDELEELSGGNGDESSSLPPPGLPKIETIGSPTFDVSFWRKTSSPAIGYEVMLSEDLESWVVMTSSPVIHPDQAGVAMGYERVRATLPQTAQSKFLRVRVTRPNKNLTSLASPTFSRPP